MLDTDFRVALQTLREALRVASLVRHRAYKWSTNQHRFRGDNQTPRALRISPRVNVVSSPQFLRGNVCS